MRLYAHTGSLPALSLSVQESLPSVIIRSHRNHRCQAMSEERRKSLMHLSVEVLRLLLDQANLVYTGNKKAMVQRLMESKHPDDRSNSSDSQITGHSAEESSDHQHFSSRGSSVASNIAPKRGARPPLNRIRSDSSALLSAFPTPVPTRAHAGHR